MLNTLKTFRRPALGFLKLCCAAAVLAGCGGGGSADPAGSAETRSAFASGPITGFGSIIVNGVRFDDSTASVSDDDGVSRNRSELRLGMMTEVVGSGITTDDSGSRSTARSIRFGSEIKGPVTSVAADGSSLVVLGQTVQITTTTLFDDRLRGGLAGLVAGTSIVEVHGFFDPATGAYIATRIEPESNPVAYKLRGAVSNLDKAAQTFRIGNGTETISYASIASAVPSALENGLMVRVKLQTTQVDGKWVATRVESGVRRLDDHDETEIKGTITATTFTVDRKFSVNGLPVDATGASYPKGTAGIVLGARVEVKGRTTNGVILATRVKPDSNDDDGSGSSSETFELHGTISAFDATAKTFLLRGVTVSFAGSGIEYRKGSEANLANGRNVEVKGIRSSDGTQLAAIRISYED